MQKSFSSTSTSGPLHLQTCLALRIGSCCTLGPLYQGTAYQFRSINEVLTKNLKNFYRVVLEIIPFSKMNIFIFARIFGLFWSMTKKVRNHILTKVTFPKPVPKNLKDSNLLALYHKQPMNQINFKARQNEYMKSLKYSFWRA